ncbi:MAG: hypothetical protein ACRDM8_06390 [Gaiellaceae bacterium]
MAKVSAGPVQELTAGEERLLATAPSGALVDLSDLSDDDRLVSAEHIRSLCIGAEAIDVDPRGVRVKSARIQGALDLGFCTVPHPLWFEETSFAEMPTIPPSRLEALVLVACKLPGLSAYGTHVNHFLSLPRSEFTGLVQLYGAKIGGPLDCSGAMVANEGGQALNLEGAEVGDSVVFREFNATGAVTLSRATIGGGLDCSGATFLNAGARALDLEGVEVGTAVWFRDVNAKGDVSLAFAEIRAQLDCTGATLANEGEQAFSFLGAEIGGDVFLGGGFNAAGKVTLLEAKIGGDLSCEGATLINKDGSALVASSAQIGGSVRVVDSSAAGEMDFTNARVGRWFSVRRATLSNKGGNALNLYRTELNQVLLIQLNAIGAVSLAWARIGGRLGCGASTLVQDEGPALDLVEAEIGDVYLYELDVTGNVTLDGAKIRRQLNLARSTIKNEAGDAVAAYDAEIGGYVTLSESSTTGRVSLFGAKIGGLRCLKTTIAANRVALTATAAEIRGHVILTELDATGQVELIETEIGGRFQCTGGSLSNEGGLALLLGAARIRGAFVLTDSRASGGVNLHRTTAAALEDDVGAGKDGLGSWSGVEPLVLEGFTYDQFSDRVGNPLLRRRWLRQTDGFQASAWQQLASVYRAHGRDTEATLTAIAMHNDRLARGGLGPLRRAGRWVLRLTVGHGYRPWLAGVWALGIILAFALVVSLNSDRFVPEQQGESVSPQPIAYATDTFLPIVDLREADRWTPTDWMRWVVWTVILLGWALSTIFVAGFTRVVRS